jgi:hypothetical protein
MPRDHDDPLIVSATGIGWQLRSEFLSIIGANHRKSLRIVELEDIWAVCRIATRSRRGRRQPPYNGESFGCVVPVQSLHAPFLHDLNGMISGP